MNRHDHPRVINWLGNFHSEERDTARLLIDGLKLISETDLRQHLGGLVASLITSLPGPVAAFPVREVAKEDSAHAEGREGAYAVFEPGLPGSEAIVGNVLTGLVRAPSNRGRLLGELDLGSLRDARVRTILLVDDFSGSGKRLADFARALRRHSTIRSWSSYHWVDVHVAAYATTRTATRRLEGIFGKDHVHIVHAAPTIAGTSWTPEQRADVEALCHAYTSKRQSAMALGFRDSAAMIAFEHTAPNNLPHILWKVKPGWNSLFEGKTVPGDLLGLFTMLPTPPRRPLAGSAGAERLGQLIELLSHRIREAHDIAQRADISLEEVRRLIALAKGLGLAGPTLRLTDAGLVELKKWNAKNALPPLPNRGNPYYPRQLRAER